MTSIPEQLEIRIENGLGLGRIGATGQIRLARPEAQNALTVEMRQRLAAALPKWARDPNIYALVSRSSVPRAFCVGGDIREMSALMRSDPVAARRGLADELRLCWLHECFSKPTVSLIDGAVMGTGVGISLYGTHRVAGPGYRFAMPEVRLGYFPDCAVCHPLARMPNAVGKYLGLTGRTIGPADAHYLGLVTHCIDPARFDEIANRLADADPVDPLLDDLHQDPGPPPIREHEERITSYFGAPTLQECLRRLSEPRPQDAEWTNAVLSDIARASPLALCVTARALQAAASLDLRATFVQDYRLAWRFVDEPDIQEGVRAVLIEKTATPRWQNASVTDVDPAHVASFFAPLGDDELSLPTREEMQSTRS